MIKYHNINGVLTPVAEAKLHVSDLGFHRGYGVFDYFPIINGKPLFLDDYLDRFDYSTSQMLFDLPYDRVTLKEHIYELIETNKVPKAAIKLVATGGYSNDGYTPTGTANVAILYFEDQRHPKTHYEEGFRLMSFDYVRAMPRIKSTNYIASLLARKDMAKIKAQDLIYHKDGIISESSRSNFFIVTKEGKIATAARDVLPGVTRKHVIDIATQQGLEIEVRDISVEEMLHAQEAFLTSSSKGVLGVTQIDGRNVGNGKPGAISQQLNAWLDAHVEDYIASLSVTV